MAFKKSHYETILIYILKNIITVNLYINVMVNLSVLY
jgi:hypothetical protein